MSALSSALAEMNVEHPHVFAMRLVSKHFGLCSKVRGAAICERITIPTAMIDEIAVRDAAIRAESAELLRVCGEALKAFATFREQYQGIEYFAPGIGCGIEDRCLDRYHAAEYGWDRAMEKVGDCLPEDNVIDTALAALKDAGVL